jgi:outer membrane protein OmpA-like peptidoglycan-associated protein
MAGVAGPTGATGATGMQGATGASGAEGPLASGGSWSLYREYAFNTYSDDILHSDSNKAREIANYLSQNPSFRVGIDGSNQRRVNTVHDALINAGVSANRIHVGPFGNPQLRGDNRVAVLLVN